MILSGLSIILAGQITMKQDANQLRQLQENPYIQRRNLEDSLDGRPTEVYTGPSESMVETSSHIQQDLRHAKITIDGNGTRQYSSILRDHTRENWTLLFVS